MKSKQNNHNEMLRSMNTHIVTWHI